MSFYTTCPNCGSHLDPGEKCDCQRDTENCAQNGHIDPLTEEDFKFLSDMEELHHSDPALFVAMCAMLHVLSSDRSDKFGFQYPERVFLDAIKHLEAGRKKEVLQNPDMADTFVLAIAHICDNWLKKVC